MEKKMTKSSGSLKISNDVIIKIAELAAAEITGVAVNDDQTLAVAETPIAISSIPIANRIAGPIRVHLAGESAEVSINIIVIQGHNSVAVAEAVQKSVKSAVQNMTGIAVSKVNVSIAGVKLAK